MHILIGGAKDRVEVEDDIFLEFLFLMAGITVIRVLMQIILMLIISIFLFRIVLLSSAISLEKVADIFLSEGPDGVVQVLLFVIIFYIHIGLSVEDLEEARRRLLFGAVVLHMFLVSFASLLQLITLLLFQGLVILQMFILLRPNAIPDSISDFIFIFSFTLAPLDGLGLRDVGRWVKHLRHLEERDPIRIALAESQTDPADALVVIAVHAELDVLSPLPQPGDALQVSDHILVIGLDAEDVIGRTSYILPEAVPIALHVVRKLLGTGPETRRVHARIVASVEAVPHGDGSMLDRVKIFRPC